MWMCAGVSGPLKIVHFLNEDVCSPGGGLGVHVREITQRLSKNHDVIVVGVDSWTQEGKRLYWDDNGYEETRSWEYQPGMLRLLNVYNFNQYNFNKGVVNDMIRDFVFSMNVATFLKDFKADIVHMHDCTLYKPAKFYAQMCGAKVVSTAHLSTIAIGPDRLNELIARHYAEQELILWNESSEVIAVSEYYAKVVDELSFRQPEMIYNGVTVKPIQDAKPNYEKSPKNGSRMKVGVLGRPVLQKGIDLVLDAAKLCPSVDFEIVSYIPAFYESPHDPVVNQLKECDLPNVKWHRYLNGDDKWEILKTCDLAVMPSRHEPFGIVALEWMAAGIPLMVSDIDGLKEFCTKDNSIPITPSVEDIAWNISNYTRDDLRTARAKETASIFTWERAVTKLESVYRSVVSGNN